MRITLDRTRCTGHGRCYVVAAAVFDADDDGYGVVRDGGEVAAGRRAGGAPGRGELPRGRHHARGVTDGGATDVGGTAMNGTDTTAERPAGRSARDRGRAVRPRDGPQPAARPTRPCATWRRSSSWARAARAAAWRSASTRTSSPGCARRTCSRRASTPSTSARCGRSIPLQIDPPDHHAYRKLLDPLFSPRRVAALEPAVRELARGLVDAVVDDGGCNFNAAFAEPFPSTVFLELLGLPVSRAGEFIAFKDGIIRPPATDGRGARRRWSTRRAGRSTRCSRR